MYRETIPTCQGKDEDTHVNTDRQARNEKALSSSSVGMHSSQDEQILGPGKIPHCFY